MGQRVDDVPIRFRCHSCEHLIVTPRRYANRTGLCPGCRTSLTIPDRIQFPCPGCAEQVRLKGKWAGKRILCPRCVAPIRVPGEVADPAAETVERPAPREDHRATDPCEAPSFELAADPFAAQASSTIVVVDPPAELASVETLEELVEVTASGKLREVVEDLESSEVKHALATLDSLAELDPGSEERITSTDALRILDAIEARGTLASGVR